MLDALVVIDQSGRQHIGIIVIEIVKQLVDVLPHGDAQLHPEIAGELLGQLIIEAGGFIAGGVPGKRRDQGADAQLAARLDSSDAVFGFARPGD